MKHFVDNKTVYISLNTTINITLNTNITGRLVIIKVTTAAALLLSNKNNPGISRDDRKLYSGSRWGSGGGNGGDDGSGDQKLHVTFLL